MQEIATILAPQNRIQGRCGQYCDPPVGRNAGVGGWCRVQSAYLLAHDEVLTALSNTNTAQRRLPLVDTARPRPLIGPAAAIS